ncbi:MAG: carboxypeptidase-like regulatory domain-containing protein, partial [Bacteroidetes bacterium]|nr:carboxypeptidase-like regulatory domain-containing protein [Bacteroidota bacterium]
MNRPLLLTIAILLSGATAFAQKNIYGTLKGKVLDTAGKQALADATISVMSLKDSSSTAFTTADAKGNFEVRNIEGGEYRLLISFEGYQYIRKTFIISSDKQVVDMGTLVMEKKSTTLQEVIIERPPISVKK